MINLFLFLLGLFFGNVIEYLIHRYVLHGLGKNKKSMFSPHWHRHHRNVRRNDFYDATYKNILSKESNARIEILQIIGLSIILLPICFISFYVYLGMIFNGFLYFIMHRWMHLHPKISKKYFRWHWEHHMGKNQDSNWCVTFPITDWLIKKFRREDH